MERSIRVQGIVLSHSNYGEADRFVRVLTPDHGKISALARGVRKINSRKAGHLQPFTLINAQLVQGRGSAWIVSQVSTQEAHPNLTCTLRKTCYASYVAELADRFSDAETDSRELYMLTVQTIRALDSASDPVPSLRYFDFRLFDLIGYRPKLHHCVGCGETIQPVAQYFSPSLGGALCPTCFGCDAGALPMTMRTLKYFRYFQTRSFREAARAGWPEEIRVETDYLLNAYYTYILERKLNSSDFLQKVGPAKESC